MKKAAILQPACTRLAAAILCMAVPLMMLAGCGSEEAAVMDQTVTVKTQALSAGTLSMEETYVATISDENSASVFPKVSGVVTDVLVSAGDTVQKGDVLCRFEDSGNAGVSQAQAQLNYQETVKTKYPKATISGVVSETYVKNDDTVSAGTPLLKIVADTDIMIDFLFTFVSPNYFYVGQSATVFIDGFAGTTPGTVVGVSDTTSVTSNSKTSCTVRVKIANPGTLTDSGSYTASAVIGSYSSYGKAKLSFGGTETVYAAASGTISGFSKMHGSTVKAGEQLCTIVSDTVDAQISNARLALESASNLLDNYTLTAPISDVVEAVNVTANNTASAGSAAFLISTSGSKTATFYVTAEVSGALSQGQAVTVTSQGVSYQGTISEIGLAVDAATGLFKIKAALDDAYALAQRHDGHAVHHGEKERTVHHHPHGRPLF